MNWFLSIYIIVPMVQFLTKLLMSLKKEPSQTVHKLTTIKTRPIHHIPIYHVAHYLMWLHCGQISLNQVCSRKIFWSYIKTMFLSSSECNTKKIKNKNVSVIDPFNSLSQWMSKPDSVQSRVSLLPWGKQ